jgi:hypothetical protein
MKSKPQKPDTSELKKLARVFLEAYVAAQPAGGEELSQLLHEGGFSSFEGGTVRLTEELEAASSALVERAAKLLGPRGAHEKALAGIAEKSAQKLIRKEFDLDAAISHLIDVVLEAANSTFDVLLPNYLIQFRDDVRSIKLGRVRAALTDDLPAELEARKIPVEIHKGTLFKLGYRSDKIEVTLPICCWIATVTGASENAREEAKWLVDIAISLLRVAHDSVGIMFPGYGDVEPHPWQPWNFTDVGVLVKDGTARGGNMTPPRSYEIGSKLRDIIESEAFRAKAELVFDQPKGTVAERFGQGLGWLTRGRQAADRAERFLYFFTAIEALLSSEDGNDPITQTISRHAATILSADIATRISIIKNVRQLYGLRSRIVHLGNRPVLWGNADAAQRLADSLFWFVFRRADLSMKHKEFSEELINASYGTPWPPPDQTGG